MNIPELFGSMVFDDAVMRQKLPKDVYRSLKKTIDEGEDLDLTIANSVAGAMKEWAIEHGATHYTHWFQPMTNVTAEKHDSFISPQNDGTVIMEFSGKELIKGEPDASSFPSGGLRATFEARGYTAWDPTSYAFIKDDSLCIPTVFCSYGGEVLDKKTPLLRSMELMSRASLRVLRLFGDNDTTRVVTTVGAEQEYFLLDRETALKRKDLRYTGRTLFGARPPKGQELDDHYFGAIRPRVMEFMKELNTELWKLGVYAKTEHNEAAPAQHELAPVFSSSNTAADHNQLTMEIMRRVAEKHSLLCLLHEKPFAGVNGSGKHNNWSLSTNTGENLLDPGKHPEGNKRFLLFLCAVLKAVDDYPELLRVSVSGAGNDHRLGASEAPPAIISVFLGDELTSILKSIENGVPFDGVKAARMQTGVHVLPDFRKDTADRNRTSPFAFTGNKFEFRMLGSSSSIADTNIVINTAVADALGRFADRLENADDFETELENLLRETITAHKRIVFNGNNYSEEWVEEAAKRGLPNLRTTADALAHFLSEKNIGLFVSNGIFTEAELRSRCEILYESYCKVVCIEAQTMIGMSRRDIFPAANKYLGQLLQTAERKRSAGIGSGDDADLRIAKRLDVLCNELVARTDELDQALTDCRSLGDHACRAGFVRDYLLPAMEALRKTADILETITDSELWPFPTYGRLLYSV